MTFNFIFLIIAFFLFCNFSIAEEELKTKDLKNSTIENNFESHQSSELSDKQMNELKKQVEIIKENQKKSEELIKELESE